ncbi:hypothetical protein [Vibrio gallaecicus]
MLLSIMAITIGVNEVKNTLPTVSHRKNQDTLSLLTISGKNS